MTEPFCWISMAGLRLIGELEARDRKAAKLLYLALAEMASARRDGQHDGFEASGGEVLEASGMARETVYAARDSLIKLGLLAVDGSGNRRVWRLLPVSGEPTPDCRVSRQRSTRQESGEEEGKNGLLTEPCAEALDPVSAVFEHWRAVVPERAGCRLTPGRREKIRARLRTFSATDLKLAIDQVARDPFLNGDNDRGKPFNDFGTIFRNDEKVEDLLLDAKRAPRSGRRNGRGSGPTMADFARLALADD